MDIERIRDNTYKSILYFAIPSVIAMLLTSLTTLVDGFFVGRYIHANALAAIQLGLPILYLYLGIAIMIGLGGVSIVGRYLGMKKYKEANNVYAITMQLGFISIGILTILFKFIIPVISNEIIKDGMLTQYFSDYFKIIIFSYAINMMFIIYGMFIRVIAKPHLFMIATVLINIFNIIFDYLLIVKYNYGVMGTAYASLISTAVGTLYAYYVLRKYSEFRVKKVKWHKEILRKIFLNGGSELIAQWSLMFTTILFNIVIMKIAGEDGITAITIAGYSGYIFLMIALGIGQGVSPMISYVYGADDKELCSKISKKGINIVFIVGVILTIVLWIFSKNYITCFISDEHIIDIVDKGIKIYALGFLFAGYNIIVSCTFTALGDAKKSAIISVCRGLVIISIFIILLPWVFGFNGVWLVFPATELITLIIAWQLGKSEKKYKI